MTRVVRAGGPTPTPTGGCRLTPLVRDAALAWYRAAWTVARLPVSRMSGQTLHDAMVSGLRLADGDPSVARLLSIVARQTLPRHRTTVGGVTLRSPVIVAAGLVKGDGFADEDAAMAAVRAGRNIVPGWRSVPALVGAVELGSYTRRPRVGNPGTVVWRDERTRSTQNRVGLRNPGARAAAAFLGARARRLPRTWGLNLAVTPGLEDDAQAAAEIVEAAGMLEAALRASGHGPAWYTLNLSCPNTDDDPAAHQAESRARTLAGALVGAVPVPVWVKVGPGLPAGHYAVLAETLAAVGVRAAIATNTIGRPAPGSPGVEAGVGGAVLRPHAMAALKELAGAVAASGLDLDLVACGGIMSREDLDDALASGAKAAMVYSALVFRGPLAPALLGA